MLYKDRGLWIRTWEVGILDYSYDTKMLSVCWEGSTISRIINTLKGYNWYIRIILLVIVPIQARTYFIT